MRIAICDDEPLCRTQVFQLTKEYAAQSNNKDISFVQFSTADALLESARKLGGFDIYILDILMPGINGIQLGQQLREFGYDGKIIYLTSSTEFAIDSYKVKAFHYILKPIQKELFFSVLDEALESVAYKKNKSLIVKTKENSVRLSYDSIMYAELSRRTILYHLTNGKTVESTSIRTTFSEAVQELVRDERFTLCGASMVVNLHHITMIENETLVFKDIYKTYLSKKACRDLRSVWYDFWFDGEGSK